MRVETIRLRGFVKKKQRALRPQINLQARLILEFAHELRVHPGARRRQFAQRRHRFGGEVDQHAARCP